ncbi:Disco-interacting protein 2 -like protein C [Echinococcus granulosus]|nr:Disco-interacting protein 2 -like protein C [Echinococcus granulosus]
MGDVNLANMDVELRKKLAELEKELVEGDITEKGYQKKKAKILEQFRVHYYENTRDSGFVHTSNPHLPPAGSRPDSPVADPATPALLRRSSHHRYARDEVRYRSEIREEAVKEALQKEPLICLESLRPSKRRQQNTCIPEPGPSHARSESESEASLDTSSQRCPQALNPLSQQHQFLENADVFHKMSDPTPVTKLSNLRIADGTTPTATTSATAISASATRPLPPPVGLHAQQQHPFTGAENILPSISRASSSQTSPQLPNSGGGGSGDSRLLRPSLTSSVLEVIPNPQSMYQSGLVCPSRVSEKIQQLVNTLKRPKRRPLPEYFIDEDDQILVQPVVDPNAPKPLGAITEPLIGEKLIVPPGLPRNIESALQRYASVIGKTPALTCLEPSGRSTQVLSYAKLLQRSNRIAFLLLNKLGHRGGQSLKPRDRVALVYSSNDPISYLVAFYGCLLASVIPIAIEVPGAKRDSSCQNMGFLLSSLDARVVLTNDQVYKSLSRTSAGDIAPLPGWPQHLAWINTDHHGGSGGGNTKKAPKDWSLPERLPPEETIYIEYTYAKDGSVRGVMVSRKAALAHCRALTAACHYSEGDVMVCVVDCRREAGLWHAALSSVFNGMHVVFVPFNVLQMDPGSWIRMATKYRASVAIVKSRDLHWALLAEREHPYCNLSSLRALLVTDGHNPWSLNSCDLFAAKFKSRGLNPNAICPIAGSSETLTLALRRPILPSSATAPNTGGLFGLHSNGAPRGVPTSAAVLPPTSNASPQHTLLSGSPAAAAARGIISIHALSYGVIRVDSEDSFTSLTLQDCGQVLPGAAMVVVSLGPKPTICRTDEVGELCIAADYVGTGYWGLRGQTGSHFCVQPVHEDGRPVVVNINASVTATAGALHVPTTACVGGITTTTSKFVRSGLIGFPGPASSGGLIFICGSIDGVLAVAGRRHNANDIIATVIAVQPTKIVYRGRIAVFSIEMLKDERIVVIAELRHGFSEEAAFSWMSQVLQAVDSIHQVSVYALALVPQNQLPRTPFGGIHVHEVRRLFSEGQLHPIMLLLCPHSAIQNLPQPRTQPPTSLVGASAILVGQVVQGARMAEAHGRFISNAVHGSMTALGPGAPDLGPQTVTEVLLWRATHTPEDRLFSVYNAKGAVVAGLTCHQLHQKAERLGSLLQEKGNVKPGSVVAVMFMPGIEMVCAFYACLYIAAIPVLVRPPQQPRSPVVGSGATAASSTSSSALGTSVSSSGLFGGSLIDLSASRTSLEPSPPPAQICFADSVTMAWNVVSSAQAVVCLTQSSVIKLIKSKEAAGRIPMSSWPQLLDYDETWRRKLSTVYLPHSPDTEVAYLDFTPSTTGTLTGVEVTHAVASALCRAQKMQCEFYPARELVLSLEPYSGLSASLWLLTSIYCGHHSILVPPQVTEVAPDLWLTLCSQKKIREAFCSYATIKLGTIYSAKMIAAMKMKEVSLENLRNLVIVSEERPRVNLTSLFARMFAAVNLNPRAVSTSFGCRANLAMCLQGASSPDITTVYVDRVSLRNDRVNLLERGSPNSLCLMESGKLLPGVHVAIANPDTLGQCADSHLGEIWVSSPHNSTRLLGPFNINTTPPTHATSTVRTELSSTTSSAAVASTSAAYENAPMDPLRTRFVAGVTDRVYARTGFLGFVRRTELTQSDGALHDAVFVVGSLTESMMLRGMRFYPMDVENTVLRSHRKINECAVFTWSDLLVVVVELLGEESEALDLVHPITASVLREHQLIVGVVVVVDRDTVRVDFYGEKQRILLRDNFVNDELDPIYVSYNM